MGDPSDLNLGQLTRKIVFLVALVSAKRVKALSNLSVAPGLMEITPKLVRFNPVKLDKHNRPTFLMQPLIVRRFEDRELDPICHLEVYLGRTWGLRTSDSLFVTTIKPHAAAAKKTLARWIAELITSSGQRGTGGSVRSVWSSKALAQDLSLESLIEAGEWSRESTFFQFHNRVTKTFTHAVLEEEGDL